jgi:hypothetical protein
LLGVRLAADVLGIVWTDSGRLSVDDLTRRADPVATGNWLDVVGVDDLSAVLTVAAIDAGPIEDAAVGVALVGLNLHPVIVPVEIDHVLRMRCAGEEDQNDKRPHRRSTGGLTLVPAIFAPSLVERLHRLDDLAGSLVRQSVGLTAIFLDDVAGLIERWVGILLSDAESRVDLSQMIDLTIWVRLSRSGRMESRSFP